MTSQSPNEIILYKSLDGSTRLEVSLHDDTIWLAQSQLAELFDVNVPAVSKHVRNILGSGELDSSATVSKMERVQIEGGREVKRSQVLYNLDMIISIGYRVNSAKASSFRIWATNVLKNHIVKRDQIGSCQCICREDQYSSQDVRIHHKRHLRQHG